MSVRVLSACFPPDANPLVTGSRGRPGTNRATNPKRKSRSSARGGSRVVLELYRGIANLRVFPRRARTGRIEGTRELVFAPLPYIAVYRIKDDVIEIVRIYHRGAGLAVKLDSREPSAETAYGARIWNPARNRKRGLAEGRGGEGQPHLYVK